jgi:phage portal protein BeeE
VPADLLDRVTAAARPPARQPARPRNLSLQEYVDWFSYDSHLYPFLRTSMGNLSEEQLAQTTNHAYRSNGLIFALVTARIQVLSQIRFAWTRYEGGQPTDLFGTEALRLLERPWPGGTTADLLARMEVDVSLAGTSYVRKITPSRAEARAGATARLVRLRPEWVIALMGSQEDADHPAEAADVELLGFAYKPPSGPMVVLGLDEVAMFALLPDPDRVFLGMSWVTATLRELQADQAQTEHKLAYFRNAATPNLALKFDPAITIDQVREFKELFEAEHAGTWNAWRTLYLGGGAEPVPVGANLKDLEYADVAGKAESRLAAAAGVPPSWVGFSEGLQGSALNAGNFNSARRRFSDGTAHHWWTNAARSLEPLVPDPANAQGASLWFDTSAVPFLREDAKDQAEVQAAESQVIAALVREGFEPASVIDAVRNHDWRRLKHSGLVSVQLNPPGSGQAATNGNGKAPAALTR